MFQDQDYGPVGFSSNQEAPKEFQENSSQTTGLAKENAASQSSIKHAKEVQTVETDIKQENGLYDENKLAAFLNRCVKTLEEELNLTFSYFDIDVKNEETNGTATKLWDIPSKNGFKVSCLDCNSTGTILAVSVTAPYHENWCNHETTVNLYNLTRQTFLNSLTFMSCVTSIKFHPWETSIFAAGMYNGEITIYNINKGENVKIKTIERHSSSVNCLIWTYISSSSLWSGGADGKLINWRDKIGVFESQKCFKINNDQLPKNCQSLKNVGTEIEAMDLCSDGLIIAAGAKYLFHVNQQEGIVLKYQPHLSFITTVACQREKNFFASSSIDGEIRIYYIMKSECFYIVNTFQAFGIFWTNLPSVIGSYGNDFDVEFYNIQNGKKCKFFIRTDLKDITFVKYFFNRNQIGIGNLSGIVEIWQIPKDFN